MLSPLPPSRASHAHPELGAKAPGEGEQLCGSFTLPRAPAKGKEPSWEGRKEPGRRGGVTAAAISTLLATLLTPETPPQAQNVAEAAVGSGGWQEAAGGSHWSETPCVGQGPPDPVPIVGLQG